jgi:formylglycine-generating enzyme required for sulfatase activity
LPKRGPASHGLTRWPSPRPIAGPEPWGIYLVDTFDNITPLLIGNYAEPIPLRPRPMPPVVPTRVDPTRKDALVYMVDVYRGGGIKGFPRGSVKALRIGAHEYRFGGNGDTYAATYEGGWDLKRILGTVPVEPDGSAFFRVPANTPIFVQPLDAEGKSLQVMRSWFTAMPGEVLSCVGCHEKQSDAPPPYGGSLAAGRAPSEIKPWYGPPRGFGFDREVQPVLDRRCAGCHDGKPLADGKQKPDFRAKSLRPDYKANYSPSYMALAPYVRRAGYEADYHLPAPSEWHAGTSPLIQMIEKGHHNVQLSPEDRDRLYTWIDFNVPYAANWRQSHRPPEDEQVARRAKYLKLHANRDDTSEDPIPPAAVAAYEAPAAEAPRPAALKLDGWPLAPQQAADLQKRTGLKELIIDLGSGITLTLAPVPAGRFVIGDVGGAPDEFPESAVTIDQPFYMARTEVSNRQYAQFDIRHDSAYIDGRGKDRITRGYPVNQPDQPVVRVTWHEAMAFCQWLSQKTGYECTLPTEAQWEWACRAGTATPWPFGDSFDKVRDVANVADSTLSGWGWGRVDANYTDGVRFSAPVGKYTPNAWGLCDMTGNVAEWTRTDYKPYPYADDGRGKPDPLAPKVVRGGSWNDTLRNCRSASRWRYLPHQPVYNVGFRVVCTTQKVASGK